jgi:hypothetical protein
MELPPQSLACVDEPVADRQKGQNQTNKNEISHWQFPPLLFSKINFNHLHINSVSKIRPKESRKRQFLDIPSKNFLGKHTISIRNGAHLPKRYLVNRD